MNTRTHNSATPLLIAVEIAISIILCAAACFPSSVTDGGSAAFTSAVVSLLVYFGVGLSMRRATGRIEAALRVGTRAGLSLAAVGVLYHLIEISTSLPVSINALLGAGTWGAMFLTFGIACSATFMKEKSVGLGVLSSTWCGMMYAAVLVACALAIGFALMPLMQRNLSPVYSTSGMQAPRAFVVRHEVGAAGEHLTLVPVVASFVGLSSGVANALLSSIRRQTALRTSIGAVLVFAAGVGSIRFATSLERAQRPPFIVFGLAALAVTLASAYPLLVAIRHPRPP
jgi:hypothetical protein